jgi:hypothetical protein
MPVSTAAGTVPEERSHASSVGPDVARRLSRVTTRAWFVFIEVQLVSVVPSRCCTLR